MFELRQEIFPVELIVIQIMLLAVVLFVKLIHPKIKPPLPLRKLDLDIVVDPEVKA